jgi:hypothetical protein
MPKKDYSLKDSIDDFGRLDFREHRFINFLKFTEFDQNEINKIFQKHDDIMSHGAPEKWLYSKAEFVGSGQLEDSMQNTAIKI